MTGPTSTSQLSEPAETSGWSSKPSTPAPAAGPRVLLFSGGSATDGLSRLLPTKTHNSVHLITPFDSGGSSASLRSALNMPAIGDLRHRLLALADVDSESVSALLALLRFRFPWDVDQVLASRHLRELAEGADLHWCGVASGARQRCVDWLQHARSALPSAFPLPGASLGNLVLAGAYLACGRDLNAAIAGYAELLNVRGVVRPVVNANLHLIATLENGATVLGQHRLTGKECAPVNSPVVDIALSRSLDHVDPFVPAIDQVTAELIQAADLIVFAHGSFFSSLLANLLPDGIGRAIAAAGCKKVFVPSLGYDPEQLGLELDQAVAHLVRRLGREVPDVPTRQLLDTVLLAEPALDSLNERQYAKLRDLGVDVVHEQLTSPASGAYYDDSLLLAVLMQMSRTPDEGVTVKE